VTENGLELSVILPAFNEGESVALAINEYVAGLDRLGIDYELLVINDGSSDDTLAVSQRAAAGKSQVRVLDNLKNVGQVATLQRGFAEARGRIITHNGIDLPFDPAGTAELLEPFRNGADVVVAQRRNRHAYGIVRKVISWGNIALVKAMFRTPFVDHNFVQAYRREVIDAIKVESSGVSTVTTELILKARAQGFQVRALEAEYHERRSGRSTITTGKVVRTVRELVKLWRIMRRTCAPHP
jgi:glycosyltransferase involved in cell wall biosynthesis